MKKILTLAFLFVFAISFAQAQKKGKKVKPIAKSETPAIKIDKKKTQDGPQMEFKDTTIDYGTVEQGSDPYREFDFTNIGNAPLVITAAKGSCGCTVPDWPKEPIMPGEESKIRVRYDTKRVGKFTKTITLTTNEGEDKRVLRILGDIKKKQEEKSVPDSAPSIFGGGR